MDRMPFKEKWSNQLMGTSPILEARECRPYQEVRWQAKLNSRGRLSTMTFTLHLENPFRLSRVTWSIGLVLFGEMSFLCCPVVKGRGQNLGLELERMWEERSSSTGKERNVARWDVIENIGSLCAGKWNTRLSSHSANVWFLVRSKG